MELIQEEYFLDSQACSENLTDFSIRQLPLTASSTAKSVASYKCKHICNNELSEVKLGQKLKTLNEEVAVPGVVADSAHSPHNTKMQRRDRN